MKARRWQQEKVFFWGDEYYESVIRDIHAAQSHINVESYIFDFDEIGHKIASALVAASRRGVRVRVMVDGIGSAYSISELRSYFEKDGVEFRVYHPIFGAGLIPILKNLNRRNHRKVWIFDGHIAYAGSYNITRFHSSYFSPTWRDSGIRVVGEQVQILSTAFEKVWLKDKVWKKIPFSIDFSGNSPLIRLNDGNIKRRFYYRELLFRIREAKKYIYFGNAYFAPHFRLVLELCNSARRGVEVHIVVPQKSDIFFMPWISSTYYLVLMRSGVKVYEYLPSVFHAKNYVIDDWMTIGSSNLNYRSLFHDLEVDIRITHQENMDLFLEEIDRDVKNSELVTENSFYKISWVRRLLTQFLLLFKNWM